MATEFNFNPDVFSDEDKLGFDQYITTLSGMITDASFRTPFCIGIYGKWGMGKTTFMRLLADAVSKDSKEPHVIPVWFNPWRFQKEEHLIVPFLKTIEKAIKDYIEENESLSIKVKERLGNAVKRIGDVAYAFAYGMTINLEVAKLDISKAADREEKLNKEQEERNRSLADSLSSMYYDVVKQLEEFADERMFRIAVFIDDLDRCLPENAIQLLEAIKLFLDLEGYLFVIGVDREVVEKGIAYHYRHFDSPDEDKDGAGTIKAEDYLDKMIQFPLELPPVEQGRKSTYIQSLLSGNEEYEKHADLIETGVGDNPRTLKRFANLLAFISRHANTVKAEIIKDPETTQEQAELLDENFIPILYIKWALIVFKFPDEHRMIKGKRHSLIDMQDIAAGKVEEGEEKMLQDIPMSEALKKILKEGQQFPDDDWFLRTLVHLARATTIEVTEAKMGREVAGEVDYKAGEMSSLVNKGAFLYGEEKREETIDYDYYMDVFPVTNQQYQEFLNDPENEGHSVPHSGKDWAIPYNWDVKERTPPEGKEDHPVVLVSYYDAVAFCKWRTKHDSLKDGEECRLPTEKEWEKAARGNDGREYPWGNDFDSKKCNTVESGIGGTIKVMKHPEGASPFLCMNMAGNVWDWTDSWLDEESKNRKVIRGGSWSHDSRYAQCAYRGRGAPDGSNSGIGFRCVTAKKKQPSTLFPLQ